MTGRSFNLTEPELVLVGAIGPAGERLFVLQGHQGGVVATLKIEKQQAAALSAYLGRVLQQVGKPEHLAPHPALASAAEPEWPVGTLAISYDEEEDRIVLIAGELLPEEIRLSELGGQELEAEGLEPEELEEALRAESESLVVDPDAPLAAPGPDHGPSVARIVCTREQAGALAVNAMAAVRSGRPPCPLCGNPIDPSGHQCPRSNGHRPPAR